MGSSLLVAPFMATANGMPAHGSEINGGFRIRNHPALRFPVPSRPTRFAASAQQSHSNSNPPTNSVEEEEEEEEEEEGLVKDLRVPEQWLDPYKALEESEWLRVNLHKWLDDEYCPEPTNVEISNIAASSYYESLVQRQADLGEILLKMGRELESISYQESFHGAFSSANAAVNLIIQRIERD